VTAPDSAVPSPTSGTGFLRSAFWFVVIGATNNVVSYILFAVLVHLGGMDPVAAVTITYALGMIISFLGNRRLTFRHTGHVGRTIAKFVAVNAVGYAVNVAILRLFVHGLGLSPLIVQLFAIVVVASITFFSMRLWVFRDTDEALEEQAGSSGVTTEVVHRAPTPGRLTRDRNPRALLTLVTFVSSAAVLVVLANLLLNPTLGARRYSLPIVVVGAVVLMVLVPAAVRASDQVAAILSAGGRRRRVLALAVGLAVAFVVTLGIGLATLRSPGFDAGVLFGSARNLVAGTGLNNTEIQYFQMYPNNVFLTLVMWKFLAVFHVVGITGPPAAYYAALVAVNSAALTVGALLTFLVARRLGGLRVGLLALVPTTVFIVVSPWVGTVYSDTLGLLFPILIAYLSLVAEGSPTQRRRLVWWGVIGIVTAVGYELKPTIVFALVAVVLVLLVRTRVRERGLRSLAAPVTAVLASFVMLGVVHLGLGAVEAHSGTVPFVLADNSKAFPLTHFLKMGSHGLGGYDDDDVRATAAVPTEAGRFQAGVTGYIENVEAQGPVGYADFLGAKAIRILGDGTFFQWQEGGQTSLPFLVDNGPARMVQGVYGPAGAAHAALVDVWQTFWFAVLALLAVPLFVRSRTLFGDQATALRVGLLGLVVFLLLFEGRSRYLYLYVPFFIVLASLSAAALEGRTREILKRRSGRKDVPLIGGRA
jgi:putative flippase GtrA